MSLFYSQIILAEEQVYRLPKDIQATSQYINLQLDPELSDYNGNTVIDIEVSKTAKGVGIHWKNLTVKSIMLVSGKNKRTLTATEGEYDIQWLSDGNPIKEGK